ncbi:MAG: protease complex subunit PrcB family protein [Clostridia bacterium]|nr:protease complex subunit PrcB family protein [Clostridia bacterium]NCC42279.1 protease complex subunit PrcB family protein [Clostridia bacterium]
MFEKNPHKIIAMNEEREVMKKRVSFVFLIALLALGIVGCNVIKQKNGETKAIDYTVVEEGELPIEVKNVIDARKQEGFQMMYQCEGELYLMKGYGIQSTGGYSIQVESVTENKEAIHIKTKLVGPASREEQKDAISCPYIVVKVEGREKQVVFE